jgi:ActR/RegA family two-component response regulator
MKPPVLLLDDDPKWLQICLWHLPQADYALQPTTSLSDALHQLAAVRHPVAVCDLRLIGVGPRGGFELLTKAKTISEHTKLLKRPGYGGHSTI